MHTVTGSLVKVLKTCLQGWKRQLQLEHALLATCPDITHIAEWCADIGQVLHDLVLTKLGYWENILHNIHKNSQHTFHESVEVYHGAFKRLLQDLIQSTFLVTSQKGKATKNSERNAFCVRTKGKNTVFPQLTIRILAAEEFLTSQEVTAYFLSEPDINTCFHDNGSIDLKEVEGKSLSLQSSKKKLTKSFECCFQTLTFEKDFKHEQSGKMVFEKKYRVLFVTKMAEFETSFWAMSLPVVVVSGSNQEAHSLASVMWQCYFTDDVFCVPLQELTDMPWHNVAGMLQQKILMLSNRKLTPENIRHLKYRLLGDEDAGGDTSVSLTKFCWNQLETVPVSFWHWFLGIHNLLKDYLCKYWEEGLIMGFVKKDDAIEMLKSSKPGTFILRFSDNNITNSQGMTTLYGRITSCVVFQEYVKGSKRNSAGQHSVQKSVKPVELPDYRKLNNLANVLRNTGTGREGPPMYCFLYPSGKTREELFDKHCYEEVTQDLVGYTPLRDVYVALVEQQMSKLSMMGPPGQVVARTGSASSAKKAKKAKGDTSKQRHSSHPTSERSMRSATLQGSSHPTGSPSSMAGMLLKEERGQCEDSSWLSLQHHTTLATSSLDVFDDEDLTGQLISEQVPGDSEYSTHSSLSPPTLSPQTTLTGLQGFDSAGQIYSRGLETSQLAGSVTKVTSEQIQNFIPTVVQTLPEFPIIPGNSVIGPQIVIFTQTGHQSRSQISQTGSPNVVFESNISLPKVIDDQDAYSSEPVTQSTSQQIYPTVQVQSSSDTVVDQVMLQQQMDSIIKEYLQGCLKPDQFDQVMTWMHENTSVDKHLSSESVASGAFVGQTMEGLDISQTLEIQTSSTDISMVEETVTSVTNVIVDEPTASTSSGELGDLLSQLGETSGSAVLDISSGDINPDFEFDDSSQSSSGNSK